MSDKAINSGDSDELQDLFDSIVSASSSAPPSAPEPAPSAASESPAAAAPPAAPLDMQTDPARSMFASIGQLTRKVHDALHDMGYDKSLEKAAAAIPDARDRLSYIATLTEQAANRTLNAVDLAQPMQNQIESESKSLAEQWDKLFANQLSVEEFKQLASKTREHLRQSSDQARATNEQLLEIMMAQDFQDLTGQVIKKVVEMAKEMESGLLEFLVQFSPTGAIKPLVAPEEEGGLENGPVYNAEGRSDVVTNQEQVDDLLASLGF
ncbi:protein phosphatase CheZ [Chitinimonas sp. BJB300]|uniref:protein phosphatase CheZ n=1 Tax=Chitinimonas sp. BJB300 TaxID=1559339 RepID=UPI000C0E0673|nr:protein phosphatase CheZ [Chitinimonas sp. BJB300]PHV13106.1 protein phosphatase CheZ [Chitinimonas sp. BJB300]TSJ84703.1 protein phosphatase CheZ [Chitinimonas sp. BJB300]